MTTTADLIAETRRHLDGSGRNTMNTLAQPYTAGGDTLTFAYDVSMISDGALLAVGLEVFYVWSVNAQNNTAVVTGGWLGSTPASHSTGDLVYVNPQFTDYQLFTALNHDLRDLSSPVNGIYRIRTLDITGIAGVFGYDLPVTGFLSIARVEWQPTTAIPTEWELIEDYTVGEQLPTGTFPSGYALFIQGGVTTGQTVRVRYKSELGLLSTLTDDVTATTGLAATAIDLPPLGAAIRVMAGRPVRRADYSSQGDTRRAEEVSTSDVINAPGALRVLRAERLTAEATRLNQQWPTPARARIHV